MSLTLKLDMQSEKLPEGIGIRNRLNSEEVTFETIYLPGKWVRVFPVSASDIRFLARLEHRVDKFAPAKGVGVLIRADLLGLT